MFDIRSIGERNDILNQESAPSSNPIRKQLRQR